MCKNLLGLEVVQKMGELIIEKAAKNTEIMLGYFLHKKVYQDKVLRVGDGQGKFPDIRTDDLSLGIEAVQAEYAEDFASKIILKKFIKFKGNAKKIKNYIRTKMGAFETLLFINKNKVEAWTIKLVGYSKYFSKYIFEKAIAKKLEKLNNGNYDAINGEINLAIISVYKAKPDRVIKEIQERYEMVKDSYRLKFKKIFVLLTDRLFEIEGENIKRYDILDEELENLEEEFKKLLKQKNKQ
ncbi:MAG: hypothetical protein IKJ33_05825 [Clostridia bacterium]|nr:hypothetical protein [Clostridia bacterium]